MGKCLKTEVENHFQSTLIQTKFYFKRTNEKATTVSTNSVTKGDIVRQYVIKSSPKCLKDGEVGVIVDRDRGGLLPWEGRGEVEAEPRRERCSEIDSISWSVLC